jgi:hypothetical protein
MPFPELDGANRMSAAASGRGFDTLPVPGAHELLGKEIA